MCVGVDVVGIFPSEGHFPPRQIYIYIYIYICGLVRGESLAKEREQNLG
jgi:hypothetical protein